MSEVTQLLSQIEQGDPAAAEQLLPLVYDELRRLAASRLAQERPDHTLQPTALVHEAYLSLLGGDGELVWDSRGHFFAAAAEAIRRLLINWARNRKRLKRGGDRRRIPLNLDAIRTPTDASDDLLIAVSDALDALAAQDPAAAELVKLRFFAGLTMREAAQSLGVSLRTAERDWQYARAWLSANLQS